MRSFKSANLRNLVPTLQHHPIRRHGFRGTSQSTRSSILPRAISWPFDEHDRNGIAVRSEKRRVQLDV